MTGRPHRFHSDQRASASIEFAAIIPVLLILVGGMVEFGRWYQAYDNVNRLATRYASVYSDCNDNPSNASPSPQNCSTELGLYWPAAAIANIAPQITGANVTIRMFQLAYSSTGIATIIYSYPANATLSTAEAAAGSTAIYSASGMQQTGVVVTVQYPYAALFFPQLFQQMAPGANLNLSYTVAQRKG